MFTVTKSLLHNPNKPPVAKTNIQTCAFLFFILSSFQLLGNDRDAELRNEMWNTSDKNFKVTVVPKKWADKSAVIIAQLNRFEYRKPVLRNLLRYNEYRHYRIKVLDKNAVNKYSEITFLSTRNDNAEGEYIKVYVGFKIIKPNGKEIIVDAAKAVKMEQEYRGTTRFYNKLAIPNLEAGDILDYYICEETAKANYAVIYFFDPVIYPLPQEYPVLNHRLQFRAERKCYINLKSLNGAPELKLQMDDASEELYYTLDGSDIEGVSEMRWMFPYREMPTIKFRAAFASGKGMRNYDVLLGEPGVVKNSVTKKELQELAATMLSVPYDVKWMTKYASRNLKAEKDPFKVATEVYYLYRNNTFGNNEAELIQGNSPWGSISQIKFVNAFSTFLNSREIPHDIVLAVPRNISPLDDVLIEHELEWLIRVKKGTESLYFSAFDLNSTAGSFDVLLEGTDAYALDGLVAPKRWSAERIKLPATAANDNKTETELNVDMTDLSKTALTIRRKETGRNKLANQYYLMDTYDFKDEETKKFAAEMEDGYTAYISKKKYASLEKSYLSKREEDKAERVKALIERDFDIKVSDVADFKIEQTGRFHYAPEFIYSLKFKTEDFVKKSGPNYLFDAGKLIEGQMKIESDELERKNNVYFDNTRSFKYRITVNIPKGYEVQGLDKLNQKVETKSGGFTSTAKIEKGQVVIETNKHYDKHYATKDEWKDIVKFLNAAYTFSEQKILFKKK